MSELGIQALTIYAFSQENWNRPTTEIDGLMGLLEHYLSTERNKLIEQEFVFARSGEPRPCRVLPCSGCARLNGKRHAWRSSN